MFLISLAKNAITAKIFRSAMFTCGVVATCLPLVIKIVVIDHSNLFQLIYTTSA